MVEKLMGFLNRESKSLNQAALLLGLFALLSQLLAFLRDRLLAHHFGAGAELDIYYAAFRIPDLIFVSVASVVSLSVLVPFIVEKESGGREVLKNFLSSIFSFFSVLMAISAGLAWYFMPEIAGVLFKGMSLESLERVVALSRLMLLSPILLGFSNLFGSITQAYNRFAVYALAPLLYNAGIIGGIIFLAPEMGIVGVGWGVVLGAALHALIQVPFVLRSRLLPLPTLKIDFNSIGRVVMLSLPRTLTLSMNQISIVFLTTLASLMSAGSIAALSLSVNLQSVPMALVGVSYSLAAFPTLSRRIQEKNLGDFLAQMSNTARFIIFWILPMSALFVVLRAQIVRVILGSGLFDWEDTRLVAAALALFIISAVFQSLLLIFMRGFYSAGFTRKPFFINLFATILIGALSYLLVKIFYLSETFRYFMSALFKVSDLPDTAVLMLPLGFSLGTIVNGVAHWVAFEREFPGFSKNVLRTLFDAFSASVIAGTASYVGLNLTAGLFDQSGLWGVFLHGFVSGVIGILAGVAVLCALNNPEIREVWLALKSRFWKTKVIATDPEIV